MIVSPHATAALSLLTILVACDRARPLRSGDGGGLHGSAWLDVTSSSFHAYSASRVAACTACHGATLDGEGRAPACGACHDRALPAGVTSWKENCTMCHGGVDGPSGAPPRGTWGHEADSLRVGAHTSHLRGSGLAPPVACASCHAQPADALSPGHLDGQVEVTGYSGADAELRAVIQDPGWDPASATCSTAYCHGATLTGGALTSPTWTQVDGTQAACGTCHGLPPGSLPSPRHPAYLFAAPCVGCHPATTRWDDGAGQNAIVAGGGQHVDAKVEFTFAGHPAGWAVFGGSPAGGAHAAEAAMGCSTAGCGILMSDYYGQCTACHGKDGDFDPSGGTSRVSCGACHAAFFGADGTTSCSFCH